MTSENLLYEKVNRFDLKMNLKTKQERSIYHGKNQD